MTVEAMAAADLATQYRAASACAVFASRPDLGRLLFSGRDAADLLHRLSTNGVKGLREGQGAATVFTTNKGRILDLVTLHRIEPGLLAIAAADRTVALRDWVERYTFREDVAAADWSASHATGGLFGSRAAEAATRLWGRAAGALERHHVLRVEAGGVPAWLVRSFPLGGDGYLVTAEADGWDKVRGAILGGAGTPIVQAGPACVEVLRVEAGMPAWPAELNEDHNPWEARLGDAVALDKGCYVGQEVIARLNTYKKVARQLVRLAIQGRLPAPGAAVQAEGAPAGVVTSAAMRPDGSGRVTALAYVRDEDAVPGRGVTIHDAGTAVPATIEGVAR